MTNALDFTTGTTRCHTNHSRSSMFLSSFSTVVEWYDFTLYLYFAAVISKVFFGDAPKSLLITLAGFAVSYLMRPLGAIFFGHIGDIYGRRVVLLLTMAIMSVAMLLTALLPTFAQIGAYSGALMLLLRCVMAFSVGGEYTSIVAYLSESAPAYRRGFFASLASAFSEIGALLAVLVSAITVQFFEDALLQNAWRIPFFIGASLALLILLFRTQVQESPQFIKKAPPKKSPILQAIHLHKRAIFSTFCISALGSITYYVGIIYVPVFLENTHQISTKSALWLSTVASFCVVIITPFMGMLSDKIGRKSMLVGACALAIILPIFLFFLMAQNLWLAIIAAAILACIAATVSAVAASATSEQFLVDVRLSGLALGVTCATAIFGGLSPLTAQILGDYFVSYRAYVPAFMIVLVAVAVLPVLLSLNETAPAKLRKNNKGA